MTISPRIIPVQRPRSWKDIYEKAQLLKEHPEIDYNYRSESEDEVRILLYGHDRITYLLVDDKLIDILGMFHDALEIDRYLP